MPTRNPVLTLKEDQAILIQNSIIRSETLVLIAGLAGCAVCDLLIGEIGELQTEFNGHLPDFNAISFETASGPQKLGLAVRKFPTCLLYVEGVAVAAWEGFAWTTPDTARREMLLELFHVIDARLTGRRAATQEPG